MRHKFLNDNLQRLGPVHERGCRARNLDVAKAYRKTHIIADCRRMAISSCRNCHTSTWREI